MCMDKVYKRQQMCLLNQCETPLGICCMNVNLSLPCLLVFVGICWISVNLLNCVAWHNKATQLEKLLTPMILNLTGDRGVLHYI